MSCKHKCKCKKQPVLVLARLEDNNYQDFLDALTSDQLERFTFEFMDINPYQSGWADLVQKRLKCMCKKYGCKPDLVSAIFNYTTEFILAKNSLWFKKLYSTAFYSQQLEQMYPGRRFKRFRIEVDNKLFLPELSWNDSQRLSYVVKAKEAKGVTVKIYDDLFYSNSLVARQINSKLIEQIEDPTQTFVTEYNIGIGMGSYNLTTVSDQFIDQMLSRGAQIRILNLEMSNEMAIIQGGGTDTNIRW